MATPYCGGSVPRLPFDIIEEILSYLDGRSLLKCCSVSKHWNEVISSSTRLWRQACRREGIVFTKERIRSSLKKFFIRMTGRLRQIKQSQCFVTEDYDLEGPVLCGHYDNGKIALAIDNYRKCDIQIWNATPFHLLHVLCCRSLVVSVKLKGNILVASMSEGGFQMWDVSTGHLLQRQFDREQHDAVLCFDFFVDWIIVGVLFFGGMTIWDASEGAAVKTLDNGESGHDSIIFKVTLAPLPRDEASNSCKQGKSFYLFSMDTRRIFVRKLIFSTAVISLENLTINTLYSISVRPSDPQNSVLVGVTSQRFPPQENIPGWTARTLWKALNSFGMLFDGKHLYFSLVSLSGGYSSSLHKCHVEKACRVSEMREISPVSALAVGKKYLSCMARVTYPFVKFAVIDIDTGDVVTSYTTPSPVVEQEQRNVWSVGDTSWLDGLDGHNDQGLLYVNVVHTKLQLVKWIPMDV